MSRLYLRNALAAFLVFCLALAGCKSTRSKQSADEQAVAETQAATMPGVPEGEARIDDKTFLADLEALAARPHRLAGYDKGSRSAAEHVERRLKEIGFTTAADARAAIFTQEFPVVQPVASECTLLAGGKEYTRDDGFHVMRPNLLQASVTPAEGITAEVIYVGRGTVPEYGNADPDDKIVAIEYDCEQNWLDAFAFGARAVLFIGPEPGKAGSPGAFLHLNLPSNLPRFYVSADLAAKLGLRAGGVKVTLKADCRWRTLRGRNVIAILRGRRPKFDPKRPDQAIVLAAPLDSLSEVPELSRGGRDAANCAALLQLAAYLHDKRPARDVILCFLDAQAQNHLGARAFYDSLLRQIEEAKADATLEERKEMFEKELAFRKDMLAIVSLKECVFNLPEKLEDRERASIRLMKAAAREFSSHALDELRPMRIQEGECGKRRKSTNRSLKKEREKAEPDPRRIEKLERTIADTEAEIKSLAPKIRELEHEDLAWNTVEKILFKKPKLRSNPTGDPGIAETNRPRYIELFESLDEKKYSLDDLLERTPRRFARLLAYVRGRTRERISLIERTIGDLNSSIRLRDAAGATRNAIVLHMSLNLSDARKRWTLVHGDDTADLTTDKVGLYSSVFKTVMRVYRSMGARAGDFETRGLTGTYDIRMFAPALYTDSTAVAGLFAISNVSIMTTMDLMPRQGHPFDTPEALNTGVMLAQLRQVAPFIKELADNEGLSRKSTFGAVATYYEAKWEENQLKAGGAVRRSGGGSAMADRPVTDGVVAILRSGPGGQWKTAEVRNVPPGFVHPLILRTNAYGAIEAGPVSSNHYLAPTILAATFDDPFDLSAADQAGQARGRGIIDSITTSGSLIATIKAASVQLFRTRSKTLVGYGFDRGGIPTIAMRAASTARFQKDRHLLCESGSVLTLFAPYDAKGMKLFNKDGLVALSGTTGGEAGAAGGISLRDQFDHPATPAMTAAGLWGLNGGRFGVLERNDISPESLQVYHSKAGNTKEDAAKKKTLDERCGTQAASAALSRRAYEPLVGVMNDLVTAVVLLLLLAIPFAFALERLLIGTPHIYRQIGWFSVFFLLTFGVLYFVNPAFKIAATPIIIFLAFSIILLSAMVIFIMTRKLQTEMKKMQGLATTVHSADVSRVATMMAAVNMGISTMRRRPLRTFLTAATVVLLTFTILTFASFGSSWGLRRTYQGPMTGPPRVLTRRLMWGPIDRGVFQMLRGYLADDATVVPRYWLSPTAQQVMDAQVAGRDLQMIAATGDAGEVVLLPAAIGLDIRDLRSSDGSEKRLVELRDLLDGDVDLLETDGIFLTEAVSNKLRLTLRDAGRKKVLLKGREFTFAGIIRELMAGYSLLEDSSVMPVNYEASGGGSASGFTEPVSTEAGETTDIESAQFVHFNLDQVAIIPAAAARSMGGQIRSITIYPRDPEKIQDINDRIADVTSLPTYVGDRHGVHRSIFTTLAQAKGVRDLFIPVLLGGMIVFATMLGSVSDREREIYTFSSLGLAPAHISSLFFAEASMYAVVGGMGGYIIGQVVAQLLAWLGSMGYVSVPSMNYSSTNAIVTILIVMGTVMISTIYPAAKASRSANPGIQRSWKIPKPEGNLYDLVFPFTVSAYDITGVVSFLKEHFDNYSDTSLGVLATSESHILRQKENDMLGFGASVALAPFDLGVTQEFALLSQPSEIEGIDEIRILIHRHSGAGGDWRRGNRVFINELRKQLLIWRSLTQEIMEQYRQKTMEIWDSLPRENVTPESLGGTL